MASGNSLCPHLLQEYFKRVDEIIAVYKPQLVKFVQYESIGNLLLNRKILRHEEHEATTQLKSDNEAKMSRTLEILQKRMWGLENLVTVLIEVNVDSWLVEEMFQKYVQHIVNEIRRLQGLKGCKCFEREKRSIIRRAVIRFFEKCDKWLFEIGTSIGFVTLSIYPTHNSLQFINNWFPISRKTDEDELLSLPSIEYTPFEFNNYEHELNGVEIIEVPTDSERSSSPISSSSQPIEDKKSVSSSPTNEMNKVTTKANSSTRPQVSGTRLSNSTSKLSVTKKESARVNPAIPLVKSTRASSTLSPIKSQAPKLEKMTKELSTKPLNKGVLVASTSTSPSSNGSLGSSLSMSEESDGYQSSLVFLPMRLQFPNKIGSKDASAALPENFVNDSNNNCFILSPFSVSQMMSTKNSDNDKAIGSTTENKKVVDTSILDVNLSPPPLLASSVPKKLSVSNSSLEKTEKMKIQTEKVSVKKIETSLPKPSPHSSLLKNSESDDEVFVDAQPFLESDSSEKSLPSLEKALIQSHNKILQENPKEISDKKVPANGLTIQAQAVSGEMKLSAPKTMEKKKVSINGNLVERRIQSSRLLGKVNKVSNSRAAESNKLLVPTSPKIISKPLSPSKITSGKKINSTSSSVVTPVKNKLRTSSIPSDKILKVNFDQVKSSSLSESESMMKSKYDSGIIFDEETDDMTENKIDQQESLPPVKASNESDSSEGKENVENSHVNEKVDHKISTNFESKSNQNVKSTNITKSSQKILLTSTPAKKPLQRIKTLLSSNVKSTVSEKSNKIEKTKATSTIGSTLKTLKQKVTTLKSLATPKKTMVQGSKTINEKLNQKEEKHRNSLPEILDKTEQGKVHCETSTVEESCQISETDVGISLIPQFCLDGPFKFKNHKSKSYPCLHMEQSTSKITMISSKSASFNLHEIDDETLKAEVNQLKSAVEVFKNILNQVQQDCSSSLLQIVQSPHEILTNDVSISNPLTPSTDPQVTETKNNKLLVDASSQTVLKMKTILPISRPHKIPLNPTSPSTTRSQSNLTLKSDTKLEPRKKTVLTMSASNGKLNQKTQSPISPIKTKSSETITKVVNSTKPIWSNKKVSSGPMVTSAERSTPFSVEDYNFQLWANEWASRQEKKRDGEGIQN